MAPRDPNTPTHFDQQQPNNEMNTPTPRTDAESRLVRSAVNGVFVRADLARQLETELTALTAERDQLRARAERAEDNLAALEQCHDDNCRGVVQIADELATAKERLRSEAMDDYAAIKDLQRELAAERARLDSGQILLTVAGERVWHCGVDLRAAIDAGMREGAK